jgi:hypothetical protein
LGDGTELPSYRGDIVNDIELNSRPPYAETFGGK